MSRSSDRPYLPKLTQLDGNALANTLIQKLTPVADKVRDLKTRLGDAPYRVFLVRTRWSQGARNKGIEEVLSVTPILPTPQVSPMSAQLQTLQSVGTDEVGSVMVTDISPSYTEDELVGIGPQGEPVPKDQNFYWEIVFMRPAPDQPVRRRYTVMTSPAYMPTKFYWQVELVKTGEERDRATGLPQGG